MYSNVYIYKIVKIGEEKQIQNNHVKIDKKIKNLATQKNIDAKNNKRSLRIINEATLDSIV